MNKQTSPIASNPTSLLEYSQAIKIEADEFIHRRGLHLLLENYGEVHYTGSYTLDLMLKRDLDITLVNADLTLERFFDLGHQVAEILQPHSMHYRNTQVKPIDNRPPEALYWAFVFENWNIDLWLVPEAYCRESIAYLKPIQEALTPQRRQTILQIKHLAMKEEIYGEEFSSSEVYRAVCFEGIQNCAEFLQWMTNASN